MWLDERLQLSDTYQRTLSDTMARVAHNPGGVPLAYLAENVMVNAMGHPLYSAHLFSILCAVGGMASLIWLVKLLGAPSAWQTAAVTYALLPLVLRYAVEARQYGPALAFSICATSLLVWLDRQPTWQRAALYAFALALGLYSQPYVGFTAVAHLLWALRRKSFKYVFGGCISAALLFLPWYVYVRALWAQAVAEGGYQSSVNWKTPLMLLRELSGGGYLLTLALIALAVRGYHRANRLLLFCVIIPIPLVLASNAWFHYFFAIRQLLFILPPLCILAAQGLATLPKPSRQAIAALLALIALVYDVRWFTQNAPQNSLLLLFP
jgi:uncharacterized membrane protein